ncbi:ankyrin repeat domain-containing protein [Candidatus Tisiphia endosymbiont of Dascillus cervinus]|uniref:ankyrin repeat domain-containing protein n=1 Tax=Candidatus Tisiphia endosymbiont of Dascillus cervinus TaxID=3066253 RepID=UPI00312C87E1
MAKIKIKDTDLSKYKSESEFLNKAFIYSIRSHNGKALDVLFEKTDLSKCLSITSEDLFHELVPLVRDDKNNSIVQRIFRYASSLLDQLKQQEDSTIKATLLAEAVIYGAENIVGFLLSIGFDPNHQDIKGHTPLHLAVIAKNLNIVTSLIVKNVKLHIQDKQGNTALHLATIQQDKNIVDKLKFHGAQTHLKNNVGLDYDKLDRLVKAGQVTAKMGVVKSSNVTEDSEFYKGMACFYQAIFSHEHDKQVGYFNEAISYIKKSLGKLPSPLKEEKTAIAQQSLSILIAIYEYYKFKDSDKLQKYIIEKAESLKCNALLADLYNLICTESLEVADYHNAIKYANLAYAQLGVTEQSNPNLESQYSILFNLGLAWKYLDTTKSSDYFAQAEETKPGDQDAIIEQFKHYLTLVDIANASKQIEKIKDGDLRDLYEIMLNIVKFTPDALSVASLTNHAQKVTNPTLKDLSSIMLEFASKPDSVLSQLLSTFFQENTLKGLGSYLEIYKEIWIKFFLQKKEFNKAIECCDEINICMEEHNVPTQLFKILEICKKAGFWDKGLKFIEEKYQKHNEILQHHGFLPLKYLEFVFYKQNNLEEKSEACLNSLKTNANLGDKSALLLSYANEFAFYINVEKGEFDKALSYLGDATSLDLLTKEKFILLLKVLQAKQEEIERQQAKQEETPVQPAITETTKESNIVSIGFIEGFEELDDFIAKLDPRIVHDFFQKRKQDLLTRSVDTTIKEQPYIWCIGKDTYASNQQDVYPIEGKPDFYAAIDRKLAGKLDHQLLKKFEIAISQGLINKEHKSKGIKIIPNKLMEVKIPSDNKRIYTDEICKNPENKYLIVFNNHGDHNDVRKAAIASKYLKIICVDDETSYLASLPREPECSTSTQELDLDLILAMNLQREGIEPLGVNDDNDTSI